MFSLRINRFHCAYGLSKVVGLGLAGSLTDGRQNRQQAIIHYNDDSNHQRVDFLVSRLFRRRSKKT